MSSRLTRWGVVLGIGLTVLLVGFSSMCALPAKLSEDQLSIWVTKPISGEKVLPGSSPKQGSIGNEIVVIASPGEFEPASFVLRTNQKFTDVQLKATSLKGEHGTIPSDNITVRVVKVWYQKSGAWKVEQVRGAGEPMLVPELLLNDDSLIRIDRSERKNYLKLKFPDDDRYVSISDPKVQDSRIIHTNKEYPVKDAPRLLPLTLYADEAKQFWVTVRVPESANAGTYSGSIELRTPTSSLGKIALSLKVLPFTLEPPSLTYSIYYRGQLWSGTGTISSEYKNTEQLRAELLNMRDHGVQNPTVYQGNRDRLNPPQLPVQQQRQLFEDYLAIRQELGMSGQPMYSTLQTGSATTEAGLESLAMKVKYLLELVGSFGVTDLYLYGQDEAKGEALISQRSAWQRARLEGAKIFAAGHRKYYEPMEDLTDLIIMYGPPSREIAQKVHALGNKIFCYHNPQSGPENPLLFRRNYGLELWRANYDGSMIYAYQHSGADSVWNDFDNPRWRDHNLTYPTTNGVIDTIAWEGVREAVDDIRYIGTLEKLIRSANSSGNEKTKRLARAAQVYLEHLKNNNVGDIDLDVMRSTLIDYIISIHGSIQ